MTNHPFRLFTLGLLVLVIAGCDEASTPVDPSVDADQDGIVDAHDQCVGVPETRNGVFDSDGCPDQVEDLYHAVRADVEPFAARVFSTLSGGYPYSPIRAFQLFAGVASSSCGPASGPFYCGLDLGIYLDRAFMQDQLQRIGDFAPAVIIAHEFAHHVQFQTGALGRLPTIVTELAADCFAGAWASTAGARGLLDPGDLLEASQSLFEAGDLPGTAWFEPGAHGSPSQRQQAFAQGFRWGALSC